VPRTLVWATELDVLPLDRVVERRDGYLVISSPSNPLHYWGNLLLFDRAPRPGDGERWEALFEAELGGDPLVRHRSFAWDDPSGFAGAAREEFGPRGYEVEESVGLVAEADRVVAHHRENRDVTVRALDPEAGAEEELWDAVVELQVAGREESQEEHEYRAFSRARIEDRRRLFRAGRGAWYVAVDPSTGDVAASCGVVVTGGRARYQVVDTALAYRRRGIASRLVVDSARHAVETYGAEQFVIVADLGYHALGLYESLGFERREQLVAVLRAPA
jgi:ribosomal protein S18 acetylase RimI-like enzyme